MKTRKIFMIFMMAISVVTLAAVPAMAGNGAMRVAEAIWAHGEIYDTILTKTTFVDPPEHSTDILYNFSMSGLMGQRSVSESAPGDRNFNGGRWNVKMVVFTEEGLIAHDPDGDGIVNFELTSAQDVLAHEGLGHFVINDTGIYFECPMLPPLAR